jgi:hypothetical protein
MELSINTHMLVADLHRNALAGQEGAEGRHQPVSATFSAHQLQNTDRFLGSSQVSD